MGPTDCFPIMANDNSDANVIKAKKIKLSKPKFKHQRISTSIQKLNDDCLREIFSYFSFTELLSLDMVCQRWSALCQGTWEKVQSLSTTKSSWCFWDKNHRLHDNCIPEHLLKEILIRCGQFILFLDLAWFDAALCMDQLQIIVPLCPNLRYITIAAIPSAIAMHSLRDNCVNLEGLTIEGISRELETDLSMLLNNNGKLKYFCIRSSLDDTTGEFLKYLPCNVIEEIMLGTDFVFNAYFFTLSMKRFTRLRSFAYEPSLRFDNSIIEAIGERKTLTKLSLRHNYLSNVLPDAYNYLANLINLVELDLTFARDLTDEVFINIVNNCQHLEILSISFCLSITDNGAGNIAKLTKLRTLRMEHLCRVTDEPIGHFPNTLEVLICPYSDRVKDHGIIKLIRRASKLNELNLSGCPITKNTIEAAIEVTTRRTNGIQLQIDVYNTKIKGSDIIGIPPLLSIVTNSIYDGDPDAFN